MRLTNGQKLTVFSRLRYRLDGKCGGTCPDSIARAIYGVGVSIPCVVCHEEFNFISAILKRPNTCPCSRKPNPDELFLRLDEYIEELEELAKKE